MLNYSLYILQLNLSHHVPETYHQPLKVRRVKFNIFYYKQIKSRYVTFRAGGGGVLILRISVAKKRISVASKIT